MNPAQGSACRKEEISRAPRKISELPKKSRREVWALALANEEIIKKAFHCYGFTLLPGVLEHGRLSDDARQIGMLRLMAAAEHWDPDAGIPFKSYAYTYLQSAGSDLSSAFPLTGFRVPPKEREAAMGLQKWMRENPGKELSDFALEKGIAPAEALKIEGWLESYRASMRAISGDQLFFGGKAEAPENSGFIRKWAEFSMLPPDAEFQKCSEAGAIDSDSASKLRSAISSLSKTQRKVVSLLYGLDGNPEHTPLEVSRIAGIGPHLVGKMEKEAIVTLRTLLDAPVQEREENSEGYVFRKQDLLCLLPVENEIALRLKFGIGFEGKWSAEEISILLGTNAASARWTADSALKKAQSLPPTGAWGARLLGMREFLITNHDLLDSLEPRRSAILKARFGLENGNPKTLEECRNLPEFGGKAITRQRVNQLHYSAIGQIILLSFRREGPSAFHEFLSRNYSLAQERIFPQDLKRILEVADCERPGKTRKSIGKNKSAALPPLDVLRLIGKEVAPLIDSEYFLPYAGRSANDAPLFKFVSENFHLLGSIDEKERKAISLRFGLYGMGRHSFDELGSAMGVSRGYDLPRRIFSAGIRSLLEKSLERKYGKGFDADSAMKEFISSHGREFSLLSPKQKEALNAKFGKEGEAPRSYSEAGKLLGIPNQMVKEHELEAVFKLLKKSPGGVKAFLLSNPKILSGLDKEKQDILSMHFGLSGKPPVPINEILNSTKEPSMRSLRRKMLRWIHGILLDSLRVQAGSGGKGTSPVSRFLAENPNLLQGLPEKEMSALLFRNFRQGEAGAKGGKISYGLINARESAAIAKIVSAWQLSGPAQAHAESNEKFLSAHVSALAALSPREEIAALLYFGVEKWRRHAESEIADALGLRSSAEAGNLVEEGIALLRRAGWNRAKGIYPEPKMKSFFLKNPEISKILSPKTEACARLFSGSGGGKECTVREISEALGMPEKSVRNAIFRAYSLAILYSKKAESAGNVYVLNVGKGRKGSKEPLCEGIIHS